jgi:hypothetical protein
LSTRSSGSFEAAHADLKIAHKRHRDRHGKSGTGSISTVATAVLPTVAPTAAAGTAVVVPGTQSTDPVVSVEAQVAALSAAVGTTTQRVQESHVAATAAANACQEVAAALQSLSATTTSVSSSAKTRSCAGGGNGGEKDTAAVLLEKAVQAAARAVAASDACKSSTQAGINASAQLTSAMQVCLQENTGSHSHAQLQSNALPAPVVAVKAATGLRAAIDDSGSVGCVPSIGGGINPAAVAETATTAEEPAPPTVAAVVQKKDTGKGKGKKVTHEKDSAMAEPPVAGGDVVELSPQPVSMRDALRRPDHQLDLRHLHNCMHPFLMLKFLFAVSC